jgi:virulence-associated protein VapD
MIKKITTYTFRFMLLLGIVLVAIYFYVKGHKKEVVNFIVDTISENHRGTVNFDDVTLRIWGNFTNPAFHVKNMVLLDSSEYKSNRFEVDDVYLNLSIHSLFKKTIQVKSVLIENMSYNSVTYKEDLTGLTSKKDILSEENNTSQNFKPYKMSFVIKKFSFDTRNLPRHKRIKFEINEIASNIVVGPDEIKASLDLDAHVTQLGFNLEKGSYLKDSKIDGTMYPVIDLIKKKIHIPAFDLSINDQVFNLTADFDTSEKSYFLFTIVNEETEYAPTVSLISDHIQLKLNKYKIANAFSTRTTLEGSFAPFSNPLVHIEFNSVENSARLGDRFDLDSLTFNGSFTNRIYEDERSKTEDKRDLKLIFNSLTGKYKKSKFELSNGLLTSTPENKTRIKGLIRADGVPEDLISFISEPSFTLKEGRYNLMANLAGDATSAADLLSRSSITLKVINTDIFDLENERSIPVKQLNINIKEDRGVLEILKLPLITSDDLNIYGEVSPFSSLLTNDPQLSAKTSFRLESAKLRWKDFINSFASTNKGPKDKLKQPGRVLHNLAKKIYSKFDPSVAVNIKEFEYKSYKLTNFSTGLTFSDAYHLHLNNTAFEIKEGAVKLNASLDFEQSQQIIIDAEVDATGTSEILNTIFKSDTFFFKGGAFNLQGKVFGDILQMDDFLNSLNGNLRLTNSNVVYQPNDLSVPIDVLDVQIKNNLAILNALEIGVGASDKINFSGRLENFSSFLSSTNTDQVNTFIDFHSDRLQWNDFINIFKKGIKKEHTATEAVTNSRIKKTLRGIYSKFNPKLDVTIDRFEYEDFIVLDDLTTSLYFEDLNSLVLEESGFDYNKKTQVEFAARVDISESSGTNVDADFSVFGDPLHLNKILNYDTFLLEGGKIEITAKVAGDIERMNELVSSTSANFKIENSTLIHNPSKVRIPFSILEIDVKNDDAILKSMVIDLPSGDSIKLSGELKNITSIVPKVSGNRERMSSKFNIYSNKVRFSDFMGLFKNIASGRKEKNTKSNPALKSVVKDFYNKYQPEVSINMDEFTFNKIIINNFKTGFYFENENLLYLENTAFDFHQAKVTLDAQLNITDPNKTEFSIRFTSDKLDLEKLLISFDYFNIPSIKEADKIDGKVSIDTRLEGDLIDSTGIVSNSLKGTVAFNLQEMQLKGFDPIIKVGNILFKKKRFKDIRFGPIENTIYISNNTVEMPIMQIQSTAIDFYMSGHLGYGEVPTNLWTAIPLSNFKRRDITTIPDKKEYALAGKKAYIEAKTGKKNKVKYKLHLSDKKYFKERESLSEYNKMLKENRLLRRKYKREARMNKK